MFYVSLNSITAFTGGEVEVERYRSLSHLDSILSYEPDTATWQEAGTMTVPRDEHAVAVFPDVSQLCP